MLNTKNIKINYDVTDKRKVGCEGDRGVGHAGYEDLEAMLPQEPPKSPLLSEQPKSPPFINVTVPGTAAGASSSSRKRRGPERAAPVNGSQPDFWVEIDESRPEVKLLAAEMTAMPGTRA